MSSKKIERALYGPSTLEVALGALLGFLFGVLLGCVHLISKPVETVKEMPKIPEESVVYYVPGHEGDGATWEGKFNQFIEGKSVDFSEPELNAWVAAATAPAKPAEGESTEAAPAAATGWITAAKPNFRLATTGLQIGVPLKVDYYGIVFETMVLVTGNFFREGDQVVFRAEKVYLGSCPLHLLPGAANFAFGRILAKTPVNDELRSAWARVSVVSVSNGTLKLAVQ